MHECAYLGSEIYGSLDNLGPGMYMSPKTYFQSANFRWPKRTADYLVSLKKLV